MDRYDELSEDIQEHFLGIYDKKSFMMAIKFKFIADAKLKQLIKIQKLSEMYQFAINKDVIVLVNEDMYDKMINDKKLVDILIEQELDKLVIEKGKLKTVKPDISTFSSIIKKYSTEDVMRANQVDALATEQSEDMETNFLG
jgi:hypothetical protein